MGLCYGLTPSDDKSFKMNLQDDFTLIIQFEEGAKITPVEIYLISPLDLYSYILPGHEVFKPIEVSLEPG